jgi:hypothetical protein
VTASKSALDVVAFEIDCVSATAIYESARTPQAISTDFFEKSVDGQKEKERQLLETGHGIALQLTATSSMQQQQ